MKTIANLLLAVVCGLALVTNAFAHAPSGSSEAEKLAKKAHDCAKEIAKAIAKEHQQDLKGQAKIDKVYGKYSDQAIIDAKLAKYGFPPGTISYEDSLPDLLNEAKINIKLIKKGCPSQNF